MNASLEEVKKALEALERKAEAMRSDHSSPLAVVGIGCRFPGGADSPEAFWDLLIQGRDAVREVPSDRWDRDAGCKWAACIENVGSFDAAFFGIGAREAEHMDPQHRLVLEVVWEALNTAGIPARSLQGSATGVYIGAYTDDYRLLHMADSREHRCVFGHGNNSLSSRESRVLFTGSSRAKSRRGRQLCILACGCASRVREPAARRVRCCDCRRREPDSVSALDVVCRQSRAHGRRRAMQNIFRRSGRNCSR